MVELSLDKKIDGVEDLLKSQLKGGRPLTPLEIIFKLKDVKSKQGIYNELNRLHKFNIIKKIEITIGSSLIILYSIQKFSKVDIKVRVII